MDKTEQASLQQASQYGEEDNNSHLVTHSISQGLSSVPQSLQLAVYQSPSAPSSQESRSITTNGCFPTVQYLPETVNPTPVRRSARLSTNLQNPAHQITEGTTPVEMQSPVYLHTPPPFPSIVHSIRKTITKSHGRRGSPLSISPASSVSSGPLSTPSRRKRRTRRGTSWSADEDTLLSQLIAAETKSPPSITASKTWSKVAAQLPGRTGKQCRERWLNQLQPGIRREPWTEEEERILHEAHSKMGNRWVAIAKLLSGRTDNCVKNHWNSMLRKRQRREKAALKSVESVTSKHSYITLSGDSPNGTLTPSLMTPRRYGDRSPMSESYPCGAMSPKPELTSPPMTQNGVYAIGSPTSTGVLASPHTAGASACNGSTSGTSDTDAKDKLPPALFALATAASSVPHSPLIESRTIQLSASGQTK